MNKNLPSITTMIRNHGDESNAIICTTEYNEFIPKKVINMLSIAMINGGGVYEEDLQNVVKKLQSSS